MAQAKSDNSGIKTLIGTSSTDGETPINILADPATHVLTTQDAHTGSDLSDDIASRDANGVVVAMGVSSVDGVTPTAIYANAATGALLIDSV